MRAHVGFLAAILAVAAGVVLPGWRASTESRDLTRPMVAEVAAPASAGAPRTSPGALDVDPAWIRRTAAATGIPEPAVRAYGRAALTAPAQCRLGWTTLAGIGWIESHHGTLGGSELGSDAVPVPPIVGPALDGSPGVRAIPATAEGTALHGDTRWERAVGPLQFLPSTWAQWSRDGDGDGRADPRDLDDAAAAAAAYLCEGARDLSTGAGWSAAVWSYNASAAYVRDVHGSASTYAARMTTSP